MIGVGMDFEEEAVDSHGDSSAGERECKVAVAGRDAVAAARELHAVGGVEDDRCTETFHDRDAREVNDEPFIAEEGSPLGEPDLFAGLSHGELHVLGRHALTLFDVDPFARFPGGGEEVGLAAQKRRDLDDVDDFGSLCRMRALVDIGKDREAELFPDLFEDLQPAFPAWSAESRSREPVGLIVGGFEDDVEIVFPPKSSQPPGDLATEGLGFDGARPRDEKQAFTRRLFFLKEGWLHDGR